MKIMCAWCRLDMGTKEPFEDKSVSHGICKDCSDKLVEEYSLRSLKEDSQKPLSFNLVRTSPR